MPQPNFVDNILFQVKCEKYGNYFNNKRFGFFKLEDMAGWDDGAFLRSKAIFFSFLNEESQQF